MDEEREGEERKSKEQKWREGNRTESEDLRIGQEKSWKQKDKVESVWKQKWREEERKTALDTLENG